MLIHTLLLAATVAAAPPNCQLRLPSDLRQGQLVRASVPAGSRVTIQGRNLRVSADGQIVFGLGRDFGQTLTVFVSTPEGCKTAAKFPVHKRDYRIEKVSGLPPSTVNPDPAAAARIAAESARIRGARTHDSALLDWMPAMNWPARGRISGVYGSQRVLNGQPKDPHLGLDIAAPTGTTVTAPWAGVVRLVAPDMLLTGGTLFIDHGHGVSTAYIHLSRIDVSEGQRVAMAEPIAAIGATGRASGPHLHFQVHWFQEKLDPALLLPPE
jgi:murein DD-endopeptidase MepM/ murein hydrolase activator NlpD